MNLGWDCNCAGIASVSKISFVGDTCGIVPGCVVEDAIDLEIVGGGGGSTE